MATALRIHLQRLGLTYRQFAVVAGVSLSTVMRAAAGKSVSTLAQRAIDAAIVRLSRPNEEGRSS